MPSSRGAAGGGGDAEVAELRVERVAFVKAQLPLVQDMRKERARLARPAVAVSP